MEIIPNEGIIMDDNILSGMPTIRGKRVDVALVLACLIADMTISDIAQDYGVEEHQIKNALTYAMDVLDHPF